MMEEKKKTTKPTWNRITYNVYCIVFGLEQEDKKKLERGVWMSTVTV